MIKIIPAIDIIEGKCVRLTQGDYSQKKVYNENPLEVAKKFEDAGIKYLHLVDLDGAKAKRIVNHKVLENIANHTNLVIDFGGGLQSDQDLSIAFNAGAKMITGGSIAIKNQNMFLSWLKTYGSDKIILGADARNRQIAISGWQESSGVDVFDFLRNFVDHGVKYTISTDVDKDGLLQGPATDLYKEMQTELPNLQIIASGGISKISDIYDLNALKLYGVIVGKAIYENRISLKEISDFYA
jgi:phosphoribosylformimino-5-aminoimidazole carboxamide ribotide isomerase